jgi:predicted Fe-Mo cluster-binding NifX family protein
MKVAIPVNEKDILDSHFGHCTFFKVYTIEGSEIKEIKNLVPPPHEPGVIPQWLAQEGVTHVLAGGMGQKAIQIFERNNVQVAVGAPVASSKEIIKGFISGQIAFKANHCDH